MSDSSLAQVVREEFTGMAWSKMNNSPRRSVSREGKKKSFEWKSEMRLNDFSRQMQDASRGLPLSKRVWWWLYFGPHPSVVSSLISIFPSQQVDVSSNFFPKTHKISLLKVITAKLTPLHRSTATVLVRFVVRLKRPKKEDERKKWEGNKTKREILNLRNSWDITKNNQFACLHSFRWLHKREKSLMCAESI
jgi:hypothetical protein